MLDGMAGALGADKTLDFIVVLRQSVGPWVLSGVGRGAGVKKGERGSTGQ